MVKCRLCDHKNPPGVERCEKCATWLDADATPPVAETKPSPPPASEFDAQILELVRAGKKIQAVKLYRAHSGEGLYEAKMAVEKLAREHGIESATGSKGGCSSVVLILCTILAAGLWLFLKA